MSSDVTLDQSLRSPDLRAAIAEHCGFLDEFRARIRRSQSSSLSAVYLTREHLDIVARELGLDPETCTAKADLYDALREHCGQPKRNGRSFDWVDLKHLVLELGIDVDGGYDLTGSVDEAGDGTPDDDKMRLSWGEVNG